MSATTSSEPTTIEPATLKAMLHDGEELAILDAREEAEFATSHLLMAACVPLSHMEALLDARVPRRDARVVWMDAGEGFAEMAAARASKLGYSALYVLKGGVEAWRMAGYMVYTGMHVPSKAFAEVVEHDDETPWISAATLAERAAEDPSITIVDSRSYEEYHSNTIPGSISCPGAELVYRIKELVPSPDSLVVVNCGGRTRSIIGAQSLINAGLSNPVVSLRDGTMAWRLARLDVAEGETATPPDPTDEGRAWATSAAAKVAQRFGIKKLTFDELAARRADASRTVYVADVRTPAEYAAGHLPGVRSVPGGQLVQETDRHFGVWGALAVLTDTDGVRATMTASWLAQMGWEVAIYVADAAEMTETGPTALQLLGDPDGAPTISVSDLAAQIGSGGAPVVIDLSANRDYAEGHVPGAWFATRARLEAGMAEVPSGRWVLVSPDGRTAALSAALLNAAGYDAVALAGGMAAWRAAGQSIEAGMTRAATPERDFWYAPRGQDPAQREAAMREYLTWETGLVHIIKHDDDCRYRSFPA